MTFKYKQGIALTLLLFLSGSVTVYLGFSKGHDIAMVLSRPRGASGWITSGEMILAYLYAGNNRGVFNYLVFSFLNVSIYKVD